MIMSNNLVTTVKRDPGLVASFTLPQWDLFVRQARAANLLAHFCYLFEELGLLAQVPEKPRTHLESIRVSAEKQWSSVRWEVRCLRDAIGKTGFPFVLLKGCAYVMAELPPARGRIFSDVDILVPRQALPDVEKVLTMHGWHGTHHNEYDQRYYRKWMHELPPMQHILRLSVLDVHHNILPETSRLHPEAARLLKAAIPVPGHDELFVLQPADMVLHSAAHLFHDGELEHGLRDLVDLDGLLNHFGKEPGFWQHLAARAVELNLLRPLYYALRYSHRILATSVPQEVLATVGDAGPAWPMRGVMDLLFDRALAPDHPSCDDSFTGLARWCLYIRSHYLRMPLQLLLPHLLHKALYREQKG